MLEGFGSAWDLGLELYCRDFGGAWDLLVHGRSSWGDRNHLWRLRGVAWQDVCDDLEKLIVRHLKFRFLGERLGAFRANQCGRSHCKQTPAAGP